MDSAEFSTGSLNFHECDFKTTLSFCLRSEVVGAAAPIAALIGVFCATIKDPNFLADLPKQAGSGSITPAGRTGAPAEDFLRWVHNKAEEIPAAATHELKRYPAPAVFQPALDVVGLGPPPSPDNLPALIERVFANRDVQLADNEAICTIKANAATRLFDIACRDITWAIIDACSHSTHPASLTQR